MASAPKNANDYDPLAMDDDDHPTSPTVSAAEPASPAAAAPAPGPAGQASADAATAAPFARRRRRYQLIALTAVLAGLLFGRPWTHFDPEPAPDPSAQTRAMQAPPQTLMASDMKAVHDQGASGDLSNLHIDGARVAAAGKTAFVTRVTEDGCVLYGVLDGKDIAPQSDPTSAACTDAQVAAVQAKLDAVDKAARAGANQSGDKALTQAAKTATFYASRTFAAGQHTFTGLTQLNVPSVSITRNEGTWVELRYAAAGTCRSAMLALDGRLGPANPC